MSSYVDPPIILTRSALEDYERCDICGCQLFDSEWCICDECRRHKKNLPMPSEDDEVG